MTTRRTPINRPVRMKITAEAVEAFRKMEVATTGDEWWAAHNELHDAMQLSPRQWPAFEYPDAECPYPAGSEAARHWQSNRDRRPAFELYEELKKAAQR